MCLIVLGWRAHPDFPLVVAANRDEFHARPADPAAFWTDHPGILAGRDLEARGTWMGVARGGRFAAVTNYRGAREPRAIESRGALVTRFLNEAIPPGDFFRKIEGSKYSGFNLLASDGKELWWMSNRDGAPRKLEPGVYGLGNLLLESPEVEPAKERFRNAIDPAPAVEPLFSVLAASKILNPEYGTRCSTVMLRAGDGDIRYTERTFDASGADGETRQFEFR
ncbi:MAG TPA: NRDE family protein [Burkholderiales bacterium]|nr:NRDE family protein [Burkholderiales bacterium]